MTKLQQGRAAPLSYWIKWLLIWLGVSIILAVLPIRELQILGALIFSFIGTMILPCVGMWYVIQAFIGLLLAMENSEAQQQLPPMYADGSEDEKPDA